MTSSGDIESRAHADAPASGAGSPAETDFPVGSGASSTNEAIEVAELVGRLAADEKVSERERGRLLRRLAGAVARSARTAGVTGMASGRWLADLLVATAPRIPVRDLEALRDHHHGLDGEALADSLLTTAARSTATVGAAGGALSAAKFAAPPTLLTTPVQIVAETLVISAVEVKLIAELHEVYGIHVHGSGTQRGLAFVQAWARQRGIDPLKPGSLTLALGTAARTALRQRLLRVLGRNLTTLGPFLTGAVAGSTLNHRATKSLGHAIRSDLRGRVVRGSAPAGEPSSLPNEGGSPRRREL